MICEKVRNLMKKHLLLVLLLLPALACSFLTKTLESPTPAPTVIIPMATPTDMISLIREDIYCPSDIKEATDVYNKALTSETAGDYQQAIEYYQQALELDPEYCDAMDNIGLDLKYLGRTEESIDWYLRSIEVLPTNDVAYLGLANAYRQLENYAEAAAAYKKLIEIAPENPEGYFGLGLTHFSVEQYQDSLDALKEAERLYQEQNSPYIMDAQLFMGYNHYSLDDMENAILYFELAYPAYSEDATLNYYLGLAHYADSTVQDLEKSKEYFRKARDFGYNLEPHLEEFINQP
jgi:tetratricopeptide (TPR) repeat protein